MYTYMVSNIYFLYIYMFCKYTRKPDIFDWYIYSHIPRNACYLHFMFPCVFGTISSPTKAHRWHHSHGSGGFGRYKKILFDYYDRFCW